MGGKKPKKVNGCIFFGHSLEYTFYVVGLAHNLHKIGQAFSRNGERGRGITHKLGCRPRCDKSKRRNVAPFSALSTADGLNEIPVLFINRV